MIFSKARRKSVRAAAENKNGSRPGGGEDGTAGREGAQVQRLGPARGVSESDKAKYFKVRPKVRSYLQWLLLVKRCSGPRLGVAMSRH